MVLQQSTPTVIFPACEARPVDTTPINDIDNRKISTFSMFTTTLKPGTKRKADDEIEGPPTSDSDSDKGPDHNGRTLEAKNGHGQATDICSEDHDIVSNPIFFADDASIVLIGTRGSGVSSLAIVAGTALRRPVLDIDSYFSRSIGLSRGDFRRQHGLSKYRSKELEVMRLMLIENPIGRVIACGAAALEDAARPLLQEYSKAHVIIHVSREPHALQRYLHMKDGQQLERLLEQTQPLFRHRSNFEYFNLCEECDEAVPKLVNSEQDFPTRKLGPGPSSALRNVRIDFVRFIRRVQKQEINQIMAEHRQTLWPRDPEWRPYTNALKINVSSLVTDSTDFEDIEAGVDAFELVIDLLDNPNAAGDPSSLYLDSVARSIAVIRRNTTVSIIIHVEPKLRSKEADCEQNDQAYWKLVRHAIRLAPDYITVDLHNSDRQIRSIMRSRGCTKIIGDFYDPSPLPDAWRHSERMDQYVRARKLKCDLVRLSQPATCTEDNFSCFEFVRLAKNVPAPYIPLIAFNSGPMGRMSSFYNPILTPVTHSKVSSAADRGHATLVTVRDIQQILFSSSIQVPQSFFIFGASVNYSLSPAMHNAAFAVCGMPHKYGIHQSDNIDELKELLGQHDFGGASISLPFKLDVMSLLDFLSPSAKMIGAVNTILPIRSPEPGVEPLHKMYRNRNGPVDALYGNNTDWIGLRVCISRNLSPVNTVSPRTTGLVIGAGGMSRAAIYAMAQLGVQSVFVYNRTLRNAEKLAQYCEYAQERNGIERDTPSGSRSPSPSRGPNHRIRVRVLSTLDDPWPSDCAPASIIVCTIPTHQIGNVPGPNFRLPTQWLGSPTGGVVVELSYKTPDTPLLQQIRGLSGDENGTRRRNWVGVEPLEVLTEQGYAQFEMFTGSKAPRKVMRQAALRKYADSCSSDSQFGDKWYI